MREFHIECFSRAWITVKNVLKGKQKIPEAYGGKKPHHFQEKIYIKKKKVHTFRL